MKSKLSITARIHDGATETATGRIAWTLLQLIDAGPAGCTPIERPAPRWSDYVFQLRRRAFDIETIHERHEGAFPGNHGTYVLRSSVTILNDSQEAA